MNSRRIKQTEGGLFWIQERLRFLWVFRVWNAIGTPGSGIMQYVKFFDTLQEAKDYVAELKKINIKKGRVIHEE